MDEMARLIGGILDALDVETLAGRIYIEGADSSAERATVLAEWARGAGRPTQDQTVDLIKAIRSRATGLESIATELEEVLRRERRGGAG